MASSLLYFGPDLEPLERESRRASDYARGKGFGHVTCGHTHLALESLVNGVHYLNSGTWTESPPCPFVSVRGGDVRLEFWPLDGVESSAAAPGEEAAPAPASPLPAPAVG